MEQENNISSNATLSALAGIMFFGPIIKKGNFKNFSEQEKRFILGFSKIGIINSIIFLAIVGGGIINYFFPINIIYQGGVIGGWIICIISFYSIFLCINGIDIFEEKEGEGNNIQHKGNILKCFIPIYNIILRYRTESFQTPYRRIKESIFFRTHFAYLSLLFGEGIGKMLIILITTRIILIIFNIDIIPLKIKKEVNHGFLINPEELRGYITGNIKSKIKKSDKVEEISKSKEIYTKMQDININTVLQYLSFIGIVTILWVYKGDIGGLWLVILASSILLTKRIICYKKYRKLPKIPILYEIRSILFK